MTEAVHDASARRRTPMLQRVSRGVPRAFARTPLAIREGEAAAARQRDRTYRLTLAASDVAAAFVAILPTTAIVSGARFGVLALLVLPLTVVVTKLLGLYDRDELLIRKTTIDEAPKLFQSATLFAFLFALGDEHLISGGFSSTQLLVLWASFFIFALLGRRAARYVARRATRPERLLYIGDPQGCERLRDKMAGPDVNASIVARMSMHRVARRTNGRRTEQDELRELIDWADIDRVIIDPATLPDEEMLDLVRGAKSVGVRVSLLPRVLDVVGASIVADDLHGMTLLGVRQFTLPRSSRLIKRSFDLAGSIIGLLAIAPVMALLALAIRLDSRGPVFFRQTRIGRDGEPFRIWKFRTMVPDAEALKAELKDQNEAAGGLFKMQNDPRVTRMGRLLRKTSLDELPQLFNVVSGDMSLVGPRPLVADEDEQIAGVDRVRLHLTPGMTGHWQILGSMRVPLHEMIKIDYLYVSTWSLWNDIKILLRTVPYMLARRGA